MNLASGARLGPYELLAPLGAGGMGEVYRARDTRLGRDVALKVLPAEVASDSGRLRRFEHEARAASALSHPNIVTVYDIGVAESVPYIAMEYVAGKTLREVVRSGPVPVKKLLDIAVQIAQGLARAHEAGIVHRDLKPENVIVSEHGVVKILDFGLAKLSRSPVEGGAGGALSTATAGTQPGVLLGTYGYMSPEQARGLAVDFRSDQFSFGSVLYEMAAGRRAFDGKTAMDTLSAILNAEPEPIESGGAKVPAPVKWIVERCLAKDPKGRYASTEDLARELSTVRQHLPEVSSVGEVGTGPVGRRRRSPWLLVLAAAVLLAAVALVVRRPAATAPPRFRQLTFQGAGITTARFTPDGEAVVYSAQWDGKRPELFETRLDHPESRSLGLPAAQILSISRSGYMAILLLPSYASTLRSPENGIADRAAELLLGTLAQVPLVGGTPRELLDGVSDADWAPNGKDLAVVRYVDGKYRLEFPIGRQLVEHFGWTNFPRVSPAGDRVAFANMGTDLFVSDLVGHVTATGVSGWEHAWSPRTGEILYLPIVSGTTELRAVSVGGKDRLVAALPGRFTLYDVSASGRVLLGQLMARDEIFASIPGEARDRLLFDGGLEDVSSSGEVLTFVSDLDEQPSAYLGKIDGSPAKRLGALGGYARAKLSPDGRFVLGQRSPDGLVVVDAERAGLVLVPTGAGQALPISTKGIQVPNALGFSPDGKTIYFNGAEAGHGAVVWAQDLADGQRRRVTPEGTRWSFLANDARSIVTADGKGDWNIYPSSGGEAQKVKGLASGEQPIQWTADGKGLYVRGADELKPGDSFITARFYRLDPWTGERKLWKEIPPVSPTTGGGIGKALFAADGKICVYTHHRYTAELFVAEGLR